MGMPHFGKGAAWRPGFTGERLTPFGRRLWPPDGGRLCRRVVKGKVQRVQRVQRGRNRPSGDEYEVSVTDSPFCVIWHDRHSADWLAVLASPYPASPDFHLKVKRLTMICASLALLQIMFAVHPRESVSHDSQVALLPYSTAITDSQYFARHCVPSKYVRWCDSCSLATPVQGEE